MFHMFGFFSHPSPPLINSRHYICKKQQIKQADGMLYGGSGGYTFNKMQQPMQTAHQRLSPWIPELGELLTVRAVSTYPHRAVLPD